MADLVEKMTKVDQIKGIHMTIDVDLQLVNKVGVPNCSPNLEWWQPIGLSFSFMWIELW